MYSGRVQGESDVFGLFTHISVILYPDRIHRKDMKHERVLLWLVIIANIVIFSYSMIYFPYRCHEIMILTGGTISCGINVGRYLLGIVMCVVATVAAILLIEE